LPNRILREAILTSRAVSGLSDSGQIFYRCLMSVADDYGRFEADIDILRARCFPRQLDRWPPSRVREALSECGEARSSDGEPLLSVYKLDKEYLQINNFQQRIRADKKGNPTLSKYPESPLTALRGGSRADGGESPPKALAYALAEAEATAQTGATPAPTVAQALRLPSVSEFPETSAAIRSRDPACDDIFVTRLVATTIQAALSDPTIPPAEVSKITDAIVADAVKESFQTFSGKKTHGTGLLLSRVPQIVKNWCKEPD
jgi:hypothetical protein